MSSNVFLLTAVYYWLPWPYLFPLVCLPPPFATAPHHHQLYHSPLCVWQSHSGPCVCWTRYIMPSFHCTPDQREQSSTEKLLLADFLLFHHRIVLSDFSTKRLYSRLYHYPLQHSPSCWKPNSKMGNDLRLTVKKKKKVRSAGHDDAPIEPHFWRSEKN